MNHRTFLSSFWIVIVGCVLGVVGCGHGGPATPVASEPSDSTVEQVCKITAELLGVDRSKINAGTSFGDLGADELDFVELVMELEEHFDIAISDETAVQLMGTDNWQQGMKNVTIAKLASMIDERRQISKSEAIPQPRAAEKKIQ